MQPYEEKGDIGDPKQKSGGGQPPVMKASSPDDEGDNPPPRIPPESGTKKALAGGMFLGFGAAWLLCRYLLQYLGKLCFYAPLALLVIGILLAVWAFKENKDSRTWVRKKLKLD